MIEDIYVDNNATAHILEPIKEEIVRILNSSYGNPSSPHSHSHFSRQLIDEARAEIADFVGANEENIIFTSCGSEANSIVLQSMLRGAPIDGDCVITSPLEHSSVKNNVEFLRKNGVKVVVLPVDRDGLIDLEYLEKSLKDNDVGLVAINWAHNETGVIQPMQKIIELAHAERALVHADAAQFVGRAELDVSSMDIDFLSFTGHKLHAPKGIGGLYCKDSKYIYPLIIGGEQEFGLRPGTENIIGIGALKKAIELRKESLKSSIEKLRTLRDTFEAKLLDQVPDVFVNGHVSQRTPNTSNLMFRGIDGRAIVARLDMEGVICSQTSACTSQIPEPSPSLLSMGLSEEEAFSSIRFSFGVDNEFWQISEIVKKVKSVVSSLRTFSSEIYI